MTDALILGLSTGLYCVSTCFPLILPFSLAEADGRGKNIRVMLSFLSGRLAGYIAVGLILGSLGAFSASFLDPYTSILLKRISYPVAGALMLLGGLFLSLPHLKICKVYGKFYRPGINALLLGLVTGFSLCPPFFAAAARVFGKQSTLGGALYFFLFYLGTSIWFIPLFGAPALKRFIKPLQLVSRTAMILIGAYYLVFMGILGSF